MKQPLREYLEKVPTPTARKPYHHSIVNFTAAKVLAIMLGVQGISCILFTDYIYSVFSYILGGIMMLIGVLDIYRGIITKEFKLKETKLTSGGIVMLILGTVVLFYNADSDTIIGSVWGIIGLHKGAEELNVAIYHRFAKEPYVFEILHSIVGLLLAIMLLIDPLGAGRHHLFILGIELIYYSIKLFKESKKREDG